MTLEQILAALSLLYDGFEQHPSLLQLTDIPRSGWVLRTTNEKPRFVGRAFCLMRTGGAFWANDDNYLRWNIVGSGGDILAIAPDANSESLLGELTK